MNNHQNNKIYLKGTTFFLTIPDITETNKQSIESKLIKEETDLKYYIIALEEHANLDNHNNKYHYHIFVSYNKRRHFSNTHFNYLLNKQGQYTRVKSMKSSIEYIIKDNNVVSNFDYMQYLLNNNYLETIVKYYIQKGYTYEYIFQLLETKSINNYTKIKNYMKERDTIINSTKYNNILNYNTQQILESTHLIDPEYPEYIITDSLKNKYKCIINKINQISIHKYNRPSKDKIDFSKHLLIVGNKTSIGKSKLSKFIESNYSSFTFPFDNWFNGYISNHYSVILWNQCTFIGYQPSFLNRFFEGSLTDLPVKGSKALKSDNPLILLTSNFTLGQLIEDKYHHYINCNRCYNCSKNYSCNNKKRDVTEKGYTYYNTLKERIEEVIFLGDQNLFPLINALNHHIKIDNDTNNTNSDNTNNTN